MSTLLLNWGKANAKDPDEVTFYGLTWADVLEADDDTIDSYTLTIENNDTPGVGITPLAIDSHSLDDDGSSLSGSRVERLARTMKSFATPSSPVVKNSSKL
jgi:hypothetical protein